MKTYQMLWDCPACGTAALLGVDHRFCPGCGAPQDPESRYFPSDEQKVAVEDHVFHGSDRVCPRCETANAALATFCVGCGAPTDGAVDVALRGEVRGQDSADAARAAHRERDRATEAARASARDPGREDDPKGWVAGCGIMALAVIVPVLGCGGLIWLFTRTEPVDVVVASRTWARAIEVEALRTVSESGWDEEVPSDARGTSCSERERGTRQVADGETCETVRDDHGDGTFSERERCRTTYRSETAYDDWCAWQVDRWVVTRTERSGGGSADPPRWPPVALASGEREGGRSEEFAVQFAALSDGEAPRCALPEAQWQAMVEGTGWTLARNVLLGSVDCASATAR